MPVCRFLREPHVADLHRARYTVCSPKVNQSANDPIMSARQPRTSGCQFSFVGGDGRHSELFPFASRLHPRCQEQAPHVQHEQQQPGRR